MLATCVYYMHYYTDCPDIYCLCILFPSGNLWRHECQGSTVLVVRLDRVLVLVSDAEIYKLDGAEIMFILNQNVLRFQVSVNYALLVNVVHAF